MQTIQTILDYIKNNIKTIFYFLFKIQFSLYTRTGAFYANIFFIFTFTTGLSLINQLKEKAAIPTGDYEYIIVLRAG